MKDYNTEKLKSWLTIPNKNDKTKTKSLISDKLKVIDDIEFGRCIQVTDKIPKDEMIIKIPKIFLLNYLVILKHLSYWNSNINDFLKKNISNFNNEMFQTDEDEITQIYSNLKFEALMKLTSHQIITMYIVLEKKRKDKSYWNEMFNSFPQMVEYSGIPMTWELSSDKIDNEIYKSIPKEMLEHSYKQIDQFKKDIEIIKSLLKSFNIEITETEYLWAWLSINTRCLYYKLSNYIPITNKKDNQSSNITMVPFIDFINHQTENSNCIAKQSKSGYEVYTIREIEKDENIWFTYGPHNDDFLQCEYGFSTSKIINEEEEFKIFNKFNTINLSNIILKLLNNPKKKNVVNWLKQSGYYDDYTIGIEDINKDKIIVKPSYRTRIAISALIENENEFKYNDDQTSYTCPPKLERFSMGNSDGEYYDNTIYVLLKKICSKINNEIDDKLKNLNNLKNSNDNNNKNIDLVIGLLNNKKIILNSLTK